VSRRPDDPSLGVVVAGGLGVLAVLLFVGAVALGGTSGARPGDRVAVVRASGPAGIAVLAGRCLDQRVTSVEVVGGDGTTLWRIDSRKGSIERRYVVGAQPPPLGFRPTLGLTGRPTGQVRAQVTFDEDGATTTDARVVDVGDLRGQGHTLDEGAPACGGHEGPGRTTTVLFALGAAFVVAGYVGMLLRLRRRR
jgi:hypothetical protein